MRTRDVAVLTETVARQYGKNIFSFPQRAKGLAVHANHYQLGSIGLTYATHGVPLQIMLPTFGFFAQLLSFGGDAEAVVGRSRVEIGRRRSFVASMGQTIKLNYAANFEQFAVRIKSGALVRKLEAIVGQHLTRELKFEPENRFKRGEAGSPAKMFRYLLEQVDALDANKSYRHSVARAEFEQAAMVSFLCNHRHNYSHRIEQQPYKAASWQVHLAEEYIAANWDQPVTIEALAVISGASARSVFYSFKQSRGYSPIEFLKNVRLGHARRMLSTPNSETSVTSVAFACGFGNLGHFSYYYRREFGELPSQTLARSRRRY